MMVNGTSVPALSSVTLKRRPLPARRELRPPTGFENSVGVQGTAETHATAWYQLHAICDQDGQATVNSEYYQTSVDARIQNYNEGQ